jgi:hypothetical protein
MKKPKKTKKHMDEAQDKALFKKMIKKEKGKAGKKNKK